MSGGLNMLHLFTKKQLKTIDNGAVALGIIGVILSALFMITNF